eukprot:1574767-Rhodomonas_salina.1
MGEGRARLKSAGTELAESSTGTHRQASHTPRMRVLGLLKLGGGEREGALDAFGDAFKEAFGGALLVGKARYVAVILAFLRPLQLQAHH